MPLDAMATQWDSIESVQLFREYLTLESVHPNPDYEPCVTFFRRYAASLGLPVKVVELVPEKPIVVISWEGLSPELPSIMLNSHMDVVPVYKECWSHPPFSAHVTPEGWIYGRGSQDTKQLAIQHLEAVRRLRRAGVRLRRTVHVTVVPDEEIGGAEGMKVFTECAQFRGMNVGVELDESMPPANCGDDIVVFYGERTSFPFKVTARADPCHGALLPASTVGDKIHYVMGKLFEVRAAERTKLESGLPLGLVTTINLTVLEGGVQLNVVPESLSATFDVRLAPEVNLKEFEKKVLSWCAEAGDGVTLEVLQKKVQVPNTSIDDSNPFWTAIRNTAEKQGYKLAPMICPGATDAQYIRRRGVPAFGLSPLVRTPTLLHAHDERLHVDTLMKGIDVFERLLVALGNV